MGEVYVAAHTRLHKRFAVKLLAARHATSEEAFARFQREAEITSRLGHPHIVEIVDFDVTEDGQPFMVMELLEGEDLADRLARGPLPVPEALEIARQAADALEAAHEAGIIHRDLKPANVKVTPEGKVKVLDFGLAKALTAGGETTGSGSGAASMSRSPTLTSGGTQTGDALPSKRAAPPSVPTQTAPPGATARGGRRLRSSVL
jgi:serine/threonine-protein kinase